MFQTMGLVHNEGGDRYRQLRKITGKAAPEGTDRKSFDSEKLETVDPNALRPLVCTCVLYPRREDFPNY
jgi:hypothetical protein